MSDQEEDLGNPQNASPRPVTERLAAVFAIAASVSVIVSFIYDWGYFSTLGIDYAQAPTTISDHVRSWLIWLPIVITPMLVLLANELLGARLDEGLTDENIRASSRNPRFFRRFRRGPGKGVAFIAVLLTFIWLLLGEVAANVRPVAIPITWVVFARWVFRHPRVGRRHSSGAKDIATYAPAAFFVAFFLGAASAHTEMSQSSTSHRIALATTARGEGEQEVRLLRSFQEWILVRDQDEKVVWVHLNDVVRIQLLEESEAFKGLACRFFTVLCISDVDAE